MKKRTARLLSILCVLALMVGLVPLSVSAASSGLHEHNMSTDGIASDDFFTISGSNQSKAGSLTVTVNGKTLILNTAMKFESSAGTVTFNATSAGTLTLVVALQEGAAAGSNTVKIDDVAVGVDSGSNYVITKDLEAGSHTVKKGSGSLNLYYVSFGATCDHSNVETVEYKAPTCGEAGNEAGTKCGTCGEILSGCTVLPATGNHTWADVAGTSTATCGKAGTKTQECSVCHATQTVEAAATELHTYPTSGSGANICTECGWDKSTNSFHTHQWGSQTVIQAATCTATGTATETCGGCGQTRTVTLAKTAHVYENGVCKNCGTAQPSSDFMKQKGDQETAYIEWAIGDGVGQYTVYVGAVSNGTVSTWTQLDDELVRQYSGYMRADALGLKAGTYRMKVVADGKTAEAMVTGDLEVKAHERTGFGFVGGTSSGAYNADGTLKTGAQVVYVDNSNFDSVQLTVGSTTYTGVQAIVDSSGAAKTSPGTPVCIRVLGTIDTTGFPKSSWKSSAEGLQIKGSKTAQDKTLTIEGVGNDAVFSGFGMLIRSCSNVEIRNLGFLNFADDGISIDTDNKYLWVHNCDFFYGNPGGDSDQAKGDGSLDAKASFNCTFSYNHFWDSGKCILLGMHNPQDYITYHHNWFDHSDSRHPRIRIARSVHIYNNYYDGNAKYGVGAAEDSGAFVEANYFRDCKYPMLSSMQGSDVAGGAEGTFSSENGGIIKAYGNYITGAKAYTTYQQNNTEFDAYEASTRGEQVPSTVKAKQGGITYNNFDTTDDIGVTADQVQTPEAARETVMAYAGRVEGGDLHYTFDEASQHWSAGDASSAAVIPELKALVTGYKTKLVKVGGTISASAVTTTHDVSWSEWTVTQAGDCGAGTPQIETRTCVYPGCTIHAAETRTTAASHSYDSSGVCVNCGAKQSATGGTPSGGGSSGGSTSGGATKTLRASSFTMSSAISTDGKKDPLTEAELAGVESGYYTMLGTVNKRLKSAGAAGDTVQFFDLNNTGTNGFQFTVSSEAAPATLVVNFSATSDTDKSQKAALTVTDGAGTAQTTTDNKTVTTTTGSQASAISVTYTDLPAGTYHILGNDAGGAAEYSARVYSVSVTEAASSSGGGTVDPSTCSHVYSYVITREATCGAEGLRTGTCTKCGDVTTAEIMPTGKHTWGATVTDADGVTTHTCSVCGEEEVVTADTPVQTDPSALTAAIATAKAYQDVTVATGADQVAKGRKWTTSAAMATLTSAIEAAELVDVDTAAQTELDSAAAKLEAAIETFKSSLQDGAMETGSGGESTTKTYTLTGNDVFNYLNGLATLPTGWNAAQDSSSTPHDIFTAEFGTVLANQGTDGLFTLYCKTSGSSGSKVDYSKKTIDDYSGTYRINFGGKGTMLNDSGEAAPANVIGFTTTGPATVKVWWISGGDTRPMGIFTASSNSAAQTGTQTGAQDTALTESFTLTDAGTYYLGGTENNNNIFKVEVTVTTTTGGSGEEPVVSVDTSALESAIATAKTKLAGPTVSADGAGVAEGQPWVTQAAYNTFSGAIGVAEAALVTAGSEADVTAAVTKLTEAQNAFLASQKTSGSAGTSVAVTGVTLDKTATAIVVGDSLTLKATVAPANATNQAVTWASDKTTVASVDANGKVTAKAAGTAKITVTTADGGFTATCTLTVNTTNGGGGSSGGSGGSGGGSGGSGGTTTPTTPTTPSTTLPFVDVAADAWYHDNVQKVYSLGLMKGSDDTHFSPDQNTSRAMVATVLYRLDGEKGGSVSALFADVASGQWYTDAVAWASANQIVNGYDENTFAPDDNVTREQLAAMLYRYAKAAAPESTDLSGKFVDAASVSDWAVEAIAWAVDKGIITGKGAGVLDPKGLATRAEICTMLVRFVNISQ